MFTNLSKKLRKNDGFTLIELIVVVSILGILAAVLTPKVLDSLEKARGNSADASAKQMQLAFERIMLDDGHYPTEAAVDTIEEFRAVVGKYITIGDQVTNVTYVGKGTSNADIGNTDNPLTYIMRVTIVDSNRVVEITPTTITINPTGSLVDND